MHVNWMAVGVIATLVAHGFFIVWWASKITAKVDTLASTLTRIDKDLEKRDARLDAAWRKLDMHEHRITVVETKCKINHIGEDVK